MKYSILQRNSSNKICIYTKRKRFIIRNWITQLRRPTRSSVNVSRFENQKEPMFQFKFTARKEPMC